jgi:hypothetical protein
LNVAPSTVAALPATVTTCPAALPNSLPRWRIRKIGLHPPLHPENASQAGKKKAPRLSR